MLKLESVSKVFCKGSINEKLALDRVSILLHDSDFVTVIGSNGAGKSTLVNCISGTYTIDEGRIMLDSIDVSSIPEHKRAKYIGRVFQDPLKGTAFNMTIEENLAIAYDKSKPRGFRPGIRKSDHNFFKEQLSILEMDLENRIKMKVGALSGGQRQALTLLMAMIVKPKILLLDEHTAALDPSISNKVLYITHKFVELEKICTLMITHNIKDALQYGNRTVMMHKGRIILDISGKERGKMTAEKIVDLFNNKNDKYLFNDKLLL